MGGLENFQSDFFCNSDCRFRFLAKNCVKKVSLFLANSHRNTFEIAKNYRKPELNLAYSLFSEFFAHLTNILSEFWKKKRSFLPGI